MKNEAFVRMPCQDQSVVISNGYAHEHLAESVFRHPSAWRPPVCPAKNRTVILYDDHSLLVEAVEDALGNWMVM